MGFFDPFGGMTSAGSGGTSGKDGRGIISVELIPKRSVNT
jgi:hypothetical protein